MAVVGNGTSVNAAVSASFSGVNTWHTVAAWHDSVNNTINIQIDNGTPVSASYSAGVVDSTYPLSIGGHVNSSYVFNGRVDEVSLYKRLLTADERAWMHNSGNGRAYSEVAGGFTLRRRQPQARRDRPGGQHLRLRRQRLS